ncbi:MAG: hypothetical protein SWK90_17230 [Chloroflexota bacterium]|nr:hypothetical protein [Chloroflexota bacterium]
MKLRTQLTPIFVSLMLVTLLLIQTGSTRAQESLGTTFTYQGRLDDGGGPVTDTCDFQFGLWDDLSAGSQIGSSQNITSTAVTDGLFTVQLDFGSSAFAGDARWLEIAVRCPAGSGGYTTLSPRQPLTPVPYAIFASSAPWSGLTGVPAGFADGSDEDTTYTAGSGLALSGTEFSIDTGGITTTMLADDSVTSAKIIATVTTIASNTTLDASHQGIVLVSGDITVTLPPASTVTGATYTIKKTDETGDTVTISGTVDGQSYPQLDSPYAFLTVVSDGTNWYKVAESTPADIMPPVPGDGGTLTTSDVNATSITVNWTAAADNRSQQSALQYVACYTLTAATDVDSVSECENNKVGEYVAGITSQQFDSLTTGTTYYFNVVVKDEAGNKTLYSGVSQATTTSPIILYAAGTPYNGNLGGRSGADSKCAAGLPGGYTNYRAFLSISLADEIQDMPSLYGVPTDIIIESTNGTQIADNWADLLDGTIDTQLNTALVVQSTWWSGSNADGSAVTSDNCLGFSNASGPNGWVGWQDSTTATWIHGSNYSCSGSYQVLCIAY